MNRNGFSILRSEEFETNKNGNDLNKLWIKFKDALNHAASKFIPSKQIRRQDVLPWVNKNTLSLIEKRDKAFRTIQILNQKKRKVQREIRKAYESYMEDPTDPSLAKGNKKLWSMVKHTEKKLDGKLISDSKEKVNVLNDQFKSVFKEKNHQRFT